LWPPLLWVWWSFMDISLVQPMGPKASHLLLAKFLSGSVKLTAFILVPLESSYLHGLAIPASMSTSARKVWHTSKNNKTKDYIILTNTFTPKYPCCRIIVIHQEWDNTRITHFWNCIVPFFETTHLFLVIYPF
jgi:hypothetical protein